MSRRNRDSKKRREDLLRSLEPSGGGGFTTHSTKAVAKALGGEKGAESVMGARSMPSLPERNDPCRYH